MVAIMEDKNEKRCTKNSKCERNRDVFWIRTTAPTGNKRKDLSILFEESSRKYELQTKKDLPHVTFKRKFRSIVNRSKGTILLYFGSK